MNEPISLKLYGQTVELDRVCTACKGKGKIIPEIHSEDEIENRTFCDGSGYVMTDNGKELVKFVQRHFKNVTPKQYVWWQLSSLDKKGQEMSDFEYYGEGMETPQHTGPVNITGSMAMKTANDLKGLQRLQWQKLQHGMGQLSGNGNANAAVKAWEEMVQSMDL